MPAKKTDPAPEPTPVPTTTIALPTLPRAGSFAITKIEALKTAVAVEVAYRVVEAGKPDTAAKQRLSIPLEELPDPETTTVDALEGALIAAVQQRLAPASDGASSPAPTETALDQALTRLAERRVVSLT